MSVDLTGLWSTNRRWRAWMDQHTSFKTPDTLDCLRYALIESCEALDAFLRAKNPTHARNNGRDHTVESELADTAMLLLTVLPDALVINGPLPTFRALGDGKLLDEICRLIPNAIFYHECDDDEERRVVWRLIATVTLYYIVAYPGLDLPAELDRCWRRLAWKHGGLALEKWLLATGIETARVNGLIVCASGWKEEILPMPRPPVRLLPPMPPGNGGVWLMVHHLPSGVAQDGPRLLATGMLSGNTSPSCFRRVW